MRAIRLGRITVLCTLLLLIASSLAPAFAAQPSEEQLAEWVARLEDRANLPLGLRFRQDVTARILLFTWRFHSDIVQTEKGLEAVTVGAPSIVPDTLATDLIEVVRSPASFALQYKARENGLIVLHGERLDYRGLGAKDVTIWLDPDQFVIEKAEATYQWGKLYLEQEYAQFKGHTLLASQKARVTPYGATLEVAYRDYRFEAHEDFQ